MSRIDPATAHSRFPEIQAKTVGARTAGADAPGPSSGPPNFFAAMLASLRKAGLGRFFGVAPQLSHGRTEGLSRPKPTAQDDTAETEQAKNIYQAMLDITGH